MIPMKFWTTNYLLNSKSRNPPLRMPSSKHPRDSKKAQLPKHQNNPVQNQHSKSSEPNMINPGGSTPSSVERPLFPQRSFTTPGFTQRNSSLWEKLSHWTRPRKWCFIIKLSNSCMISKLKKRIVRWKQKFKMKFESGK